MKRLLSGVCAAALIATSVAAQTLSGGGGSTGANPSASVGTTAVNGSATTFMRSDAAPAISQSISPTWSGTHTFSNAPVFSNQSGTRTALGLGTAATANTGSSGAGVVPTYDANGTWSGTNQFSSNLNIGSRAVILSGQYLETGFAGQVIITATTPTISSGCGTSPTVTGNTSTAAFQLTIGSSPGTTCTLSMPTSENPQHGWHCVADDITTLTIVAHQTAMASTSSVQLTFYGITTGVATAPTASDKILVSCMGF